MNKLVLFATLLGALLIFSACEPAMAMVHKKKEKNARIEQCAKEAKDPCEKTAKEACKKKSRFQKMACEEAARQACMESAKKACK